MKVSAAEMPPRQVALEIEVEQDRLDRAMAQAYRRLAGRVNVPGFRKGKAPPTMVDRFLGRDRVVEDALEHLLPDVVSDAMEQEGLKPFAGPRVESVEFNPLRLKATVPLAPHVDLGDYSGLGIEVSDVNVSDEQVDEVLERLRNEYAQWVPVERPAAVGDRVSIDLKGETRDPEKVLLDTKDAEYVVDLEGPQPAPGFAEALVGMSADEDRDVTLTLPEDYRDKDVAGKPVYFQIRLHWVKEKQLPEVDEAFAQQVGEFADVGELRQGIEDSIRQREDDRHQQEQLDAALKKLVEIATIEFPPQVVDRQAERLHDSYTRLIQQQGMPLDQYLRILGKDEAAFREELRTEAENQVRQGLALDAFADAESIVVTPEELDEEMQRLAASNPQASASRGRQDPEMRARLEGSLRERKARERLVQLATENGHRAGGVAQADEESASGSAESSDTQVEDQPAEAARPTEENNS